MLSDDELLACRMKDTHLRNKDKKGRLSLLLAKSGSHENVSPEKNMYTHRFTILFNQENVEYLFNCKVFTQFLRSQFSEENIEFWLACEDFKTTESATKLQSKAKQIHAIFIDKEAPKEVCIHLHFEQILKNVLFSIQLRNMETGVFKL
uniref:Regulator of G protein signaling 18 n=1 Tax=Cyprinus carpio TaxID=7962 RepID=A0A8C1UT73_CYPCA